jgi:hypothetical protein
MMMASNTAGTRAIRARRSRLTKGASRKLSKPAKVTGISTSRAKYRAATTTTEAVNVSRVPTPGRSGGGTRWRGSAIGPGWSDISLIPLVTP